MTLIGWPRYDQPFMIIAGGRGHFVMVQHPLPHMIIQPPLKLPSLFINNPKTLKRLPYILICHCTSLSP